MEFMSAFQKTLVVDDEGALLVDSAWIREKLQEGNAD